jgi:2-polyprenyl-6-methoxyphenol hydroxylase-like FAD-dependent oxidoreductase
MPVALIVGAGIGGLAAGLALRRAGWDIRIFERTSAARELGFGLGLAPNAIAALREIGVADAVVPRGITPAAGEIRHMDGRVIRRMAMRPGDLPPDDAMRLVLRPALHGALLDAVGPHTVEVSSAATGFELEGTGVRLRLANGAAATGDLLVGADGVHSVIRAQLHPAEPPPRRSRYFALRGASPAVDQLGGLQAIWYFGPGLESGVVQASADTVYWFLSLFADDVRAGPSDVDSVFRRCAAGFDRQFHAVTGATRPGDMRLDELFERDPLTHWGLGPVTLLGDAAHPMLPYTGQGAAQALEDAAGLGRALRAHVDVSAALRRYEAVRARRTRPIVQSGPRIARITTTRNRAIGLLRNTAIRLIPQAAIMKALAGGGADPNRDLGRRLD